MKTIKLQVLSSHHIVMTFTSTSTYHHHERTTKSFPLFNKWRTQWRHSSFKCYWVIRLSSTYHHHERTTKSFPLLASEEHKEDVQSSKCCWVITISCLSFVHFRFWASEEHKDIQPSSITELSQCRVFHLFISAFKQVKNTKKIFNLQVLLSHHNVVSFICSFPLLSKWRTQRRYSTFKYYWVITMSCLSFVHFRFWASKEHKKTIQPSVLFSHHNIMYFTFHPL